MFFSTEHLRLFYIILLFNTFWTSALAQYYPFTVLNADNGLPSNYVYRITQDASGQIWIASLNGIAKYDGYSFEKFTVPDGLPSNDVFEITEDYNNRLWLLNNNNILSFLRNDSIFSFESHEHSRNKIEKITRDSVYIDDGKDVLVFDKNNLIRKENRLIYSGHLLREWGITQSDSIRNSYVFNKFEKQRANLLLNYDSIRLSFYSENSENVIRIYKDSVGVQQDVIHLDKDDNWSIKRPIAYYNIANEILQLYHGKSLYLMKNDMSLDSVEIHLPKSQEINTIFYDRNENLWVATKDGILFINSDVIKNRILTEDETTGKDIISLFKYRDKYIYSTNRGNIYMYDKKEHYLIYEHPEVGKIEPIYDIQIKGDELFFAYKNIGILVLDLSQYKQKPLKAINFTDYLMDKHPTIELSTKNSWNSTKKFIIDDKMHSLMLSKGLLFIDQDEKRDKIISDTFSLDYDQYDKRYLLTRKKGLYSLGSNGLAIVHPEISKSKLVHFLDKEHYFVSNDYLESWVCTDAFCIAQSDFDGFDIKSIQLVNNEIWLVHNYGVLQARFDVETQKLAIIKDFPINQITNSNKVNDLIVEDDRLIIATNKGIFYANKENFNITKSEIVLKIKKVKTDAEEFSSPHKLLIPYDDRNVNIEFTSLSYKMKNKISYNYQLVGVDKNIQKTENRSVRYPDLKPGSYVFNIYASDELNRRSQEHSIKIEVRRPWWLSPYFFIACICGTLLVFYLIYRNREKQLLRKVEISKKFAELELNALQSQMNPHFVFNSMGSLQNLVQNNKVELADMYIAKFAKLMRLFLEGSKHKFVTINEEIDIILAYFELEKLRFQDKISLVYENDLSPIDMEQKIPANLLQPFVENAINHGIFHKKNGGTIQLKLLKNENEILIQIIDDGVGRKKAEEYKDKNIDHHQSRAIGILQDKINAIKKLEGIEIKYEISDLYKNDLAAGTCVNISMRRDKIYSA